MVEKQGKGLEYWLNCAGSCQRNPRILSPEFSYSREKWIFNLLQRLSLRFYWHPNLFLNRYTQPGSKRRKESKHTQVSCRNLNKNCKDFFFWGKGKDLRFHVMPKIFLQEKSSQMFKWLRACWTTGTVSWGKNWERGDWQVVLRNPNITPRNTQWDQSLLAEQKTHILFVIFISLNIHPQRQ